MNVPFQFVVPFLSYVRRPPHLGERIGDPGGWNPAGVLPFRNYAQRCFSGLRRWRCAFGVAGLELASSRFFAFGSYSVFKGFEGRFRPHLGERIGILLGFCCFATTPNRASQVFGGDVAPLALLVWSLLAIGFSLSGPNVFKGFGGWVRPHLGERIGDPVRWNPAGGGLWRWRCTFGVAGLELASNRFFAFGSYSF